MVTTWLTFLLTIACMMDIWFSGMPCSLPSALLAFVVEMILVIFTVYVVNDGTLNGRSFVLLTGVSVLVTMSFALYTNSVYYCFHKTATRENNGGDKRDATEKV